MADTPTPSDPTLCWWLRVTTLQVFDDDDFEVRSPENWLSLARDSEGNMAGLPARALFIQSDSTGQWRESKVNGLWSDGLKYSGAGR